MAAVAAYWEGGSCEDPAGCVRDGVDFSVLVSNFTFFDCVVQGGFFCLFVLRTTEAFSSLPFSLQKKGITDLANSVGNR